MNAGVPQKVLGAVLVLVLALVLMAIPGAEPTHAQDMPKAVDNGSCIVCHGGIEDMHPYAPVTCVGCHGGNAQAAEKEKAHVPRKRRPPADERVLGLGWDPAYTRFRDPGNLRVVDKSCGLCHPQATYDVKHSLHASTAGHLGDGLYENGVVTKRHPAVSVFPIKDDKPPEGPRPAGAIRQLKQIPAASFGGNPRSVSTHFTDLPRKSCMQCHLWSRGRAVRGRAGMDGDYRGEGCSACHVPYADDGLSLSRDPTVDRFEPGHPKEHRMVRYADTQTCTRCHYGDASIGLSFRGLAQPVPGMPQTPDAPGLHRKRLNGMYYIEDPAATPPDLHHKAGMHCVDCHPRDDVMGDGFVYKRMEDGTAMGCEVCHGNADAYGTGVTKRGKKLPHFEVRGNERFLKSHVTGKLHRVKQARDVVRPGSPDYNPRAALSMTDDHTRLECYTCHSGWNPNFFGFHFDRNEQFDQLDLLSGQRTTGRVSTQEKVFSTFKHFYLGWNSHGRIAPYMVGFSSMATVHDKDGELVIDQELPVTRKGLSGMTMIHHQTHTTTARARVCVECHRSPATFGRGSVNFRLARDFAIAVGDSGVRTVSIDRENPANSAQLSAAPVEQARAVAVRTNRVTGHVRHVYVASPKEGLVVCDFELPGFPKVVSRAKDLAVDPRRMVVAASRLYLADGKAGLRVFDIATPTKPKQRAHLPDVAAYDLFRDGNTLYVASREKGLAVVDVREPDEPVVIHAGYDVNLEDTGQKLTMSVEVLFQYSRPNPEKLEAPRSAARNLAAVGDERTGLWLVDVTRPDAPRTISHYPGGGVTDLALGTIYELGSEGGAIPTQERDYAFLLRGGNTLVLVDVTDPYQPKEKGGVRLRAGSRSLRVARVYSPPFLRTYVLTAGITGVQITDVTDPTKPTVVATLPVGLASYDLDLEEFPLDRTVDADGAPIMDVSHEGARWLDRREFDRAMRVPVIDLPPPVVDGDDE